ncbi:MAG: autotransporter domain-containing protein [bacterium]|nr:autotransporter domain-containing protein [bacterium]
MYLLVPPQTRAAVVRRGQINRGTAALLATIALVATPTVLLRGAVLVAGLTATSVSAIADGGAGGTYCVGRFRCQGEAGKDNPIGTGGTGGTGGPISAFNVGGATMASGGGGGGAGYQIGGSGGHGETVGKAAGAQVSPLTAAETGADGRSLGGGGGGGVHGFVGSTYAGGSYRGSDGGNGGNVPEYFSGLDAYGGGGGAGGYGLVLTGANNVTITQSQTGGNGGNGGNAASGHRSLGGGGGSGGIGLLFTNAAGATVTINAAVRGGTGGDGGEGSGYYEESTLLRDGPGSAGAGGVGIKGQNLQIVMGAAGSVGGGINGDMPKGMPIEGYVPGWEELGILAPAIVFTGGVNSLTLHNGASIFGRVVAFSEKDRLVLDSGASDSSFDVSALNSQYVNFGRMIKSGSGTWTITGTQSGSPLVLDIQSGRLDLVGASWTIGGGSSNSATLSVGTGSILRVQDSGLLNSGQITVDAGGQLEGRFDNSGSITNSGTLAGKLFHNYGSVLNTATGVWTSDSSLNRGSIVNNGTWKISNTVYNDGTIDNNSLMTGTLSNANRFNNNTIGALTANFSGLLINTGGKTENSGVIIGDVIISGGTVELVGAGRIEGSAVVNLTNAFGTFDISSTNLGATIRTLDGVANSHVTLGATTLTIAGGSTTYAGTIQGAGGLTIAGGKQVLSGINTYTGATNINGGHLVVNGSIASSSIVNINSGATLSGTGALGNTNNNGGTVSPGNSVGTININGNYNMGPGSRYYVEINGDTSDLVKVSGSANIQSSVFEIAHDTNKASAPVLPGKTYTILTTGGGLANTSPAVGIADFPFLNFALHGDGFNAYLTTSRGAGAFAELATTRNETAVANALDAAASTNPLWQQVVGASEAQARAAFTSLSNASIHANAASMLSDQSHYLRDAVTDRLRQDFAYGTPLAPAGNALSYAPEAPRNAYAAVRAIPFYKAPPLAAAPTSPQVYAVWAQALGSWGSLKGDGNAARTDQSLGGVISGIDITLNGRWRIGLAGGYSQSIFKSPGIAASGSADSYHIALYGGGQAGAWGLRGGASFSWNDVFTSRQVTVVNLGGPQRGHYASQTTQVFGEVAYQFAFAAGGLEPFANIAFVDVDGGINELGVAAVTGSARLATTYTTLGARGATALTSTLTARGTLAWRHALGDITPVAALAFQSGGAAFALAGSPIAGDALVAEAGLDLAVA